MPIKLNKILPPVRIIAVDNKEDELDDIRKGFEAACIPCASLLYDKAFGYDLKDYVDTSHVRYVFMDLNLDEIEITNNKMIAQFLEDAIKKLKIIGPYILIFWTKHETQASNVMKILKDKVDSSFNLPFHFTVIDKKKFKLSNYADDEEKYKEKIDELTKTLTDIFKNKTIFSSIISWENKVIEAASNTIKTIHDTIRVSQATGVAQKDDDFTRLLKILASSAWGKAALDNWGHSVASGLSPFLSDNLDYAISSDAAYSNVWSKALTREPASKLPKTVQASTLNTSCLLDTTCKIKEAYGAWLEFTIAVTSSRYETFFGTSGKSLLKEFINCDIIPADTIKSVKSVKLGLLDITRSCDYANRKHGVRRFALGAIIPSDLGDYVKWESPSSITSSGEKHYVDKRHEAIYKFPLVMLENSANSKQEHIIQINFKYVLSLPEKCTLIADNVVTPRYRVRRQLLADIIAQYGAHISSPGIVRYK